VPLSKPPSQVCTPWSLLSAARLPVIIDAQRALLTVTVRAGGARFIPSDFSSD